MKALNNFKNIFLLLFFVLSFAGQLQGAEVGIPHYDNYPPTPAVDYQGESLDFYSVKNSYGEFSNFALFPLIIEGVSWPTSEHFYQAHKYLDPELIEKVRQAPTPMDAAKIGRDPKFPKRSDWDTYKDVAMEIAVVAKFSQHPILQELLKSTNKSFLYEHTKNDCYWGDCGDRTGKNKLGLLLMKIRTILK